MHDEELPMTEPSTDDPAQRTARHLTVAIRAIDEAFGDGHAAANPALVAAFLQSASIEAAILSGESVAAMLDAQAQRSVTQVCAAMESLRPRLFG